MSSSAIVLLVCWLALFSQLAHSQQASSNLSPAESLYSNLSLVMPELAKFGDFNVGVKTIEIDGPNLLKVAGGRSLTIEVWYPTKTTQANNEALAVYSDVTRSKNAFSIQGKALRNAEAYANTEESFPLVILSHGYTGYRSMMFYLGEHLASHGYVVASIDHTDSTNKEIDFINNNFAGFKSTLLHRSLDQQSVLEYFASQKNTFSVDASLSSVVGYSMGGYGALNAVGACYHFPVTVAKTFGFNAKSEKALIETLNSCSAGKTVADPRWASMVAIAPWGGTHKLFSKVENIKVPSLFIAGDQDDVSGYENGVKMLYEQTGAQDKYLLVYKNARHNLAGHPAPKVAHEDQLSFGHYYEPTWDTQVKNHINQHMILAFLNCHVKSQSSGCGMLPTRTNSTQIMQEDGSLPKAWPGFKDRYATGLLFLRGTKN